MSVQDSFPAKDVSIAIVIAAMIQFINVMDFMMVMPLGPDFSKALGIPLNAMGEVGGVYTFSAGIVGFIAALFIDRFARKTAILACMAGLIVATFLGGFVWNEASMIATRMMAGAFGGPLSSLSLALVADISTPQTRGSAMGKVMGGFAVASVFGVPFGLELAQHFTWRAPFISTALMGVAILAVASFKLPYYTSSSVGQKLPQLFASLVTMMSSRLPLMAYAMISIAMMAGFMIIPNISTHIQANLGYPRDQMGLLYLIGGSVSFLGMRLAGNLTDRTSSTLTISLFTGLVVAVLLMGFVFFSSTTPVLLLFPLFMVALTGRMVCAQALSSRIPPAHERGAYMSLQSSVTQLASSLGAYYSSRILIEQDGRLLHVPTLGLTAIALSILVPVICWRIEAGLRQKSAKIEVLV